METSIVDVVIGMQYGDEGKGKIANQMVSTGNYDYVIRFNGGGNAGHTIYLNGEKLLHILFLAAFCMVFLVSSVMVVLSIRKNYLTNLSILKDLDLTHRF